MFIPGHEYFRKDLHKKYGGQRQGGVSTPQNFPIIMLFTGETGEEYGYKDRWDSTGDFLYTGEGQTGDMTFVRGNRAIRDHIDNRKDIHLFKYVRSGTVRYVDQMICNSFEVKLGPDMNGNQRNIIVFRLMPLSAFQLNNEKQEAREDLFSKLSLADLKKVALGKSLDPIKSTERTVRVFERSIAIKIYVHKRADGKCEACNSEAPFFTFSGNPYLEIHHIRRLSDGGPDHPEWVIGVCPNCHRRSHFSIDKDQINERMKTIVVAKEKQFYD